jgi:DNA invertase Pin-like site-specific DNA recombinase
MLKTLAPGHMVTVTRIDRLARSTFDLFAIVKQIVDAGGQFRSLAQSPRRFIFGQIFEQIENLAAQTCCL